MQALKIAAALIAASLVTGTALAQVSFEIPASVVAPKSTLTRAQVLADFLVWRASGLDDLTRRGDSNVDIYSAEYKNAQARYAYLRASAQFAALVDQIERDGSAKIIFAQRR